MSSVSLSISSRYSKADAWISSNISFSRAESRSYRCCWSCCTAEKKAYFRLKFRSQPNKYFVSVVKLSVPTVIQQYTPSLSSVVLTACVSKFGIAAMAGYGIVNKLDMILFMPAMCLNMALTAIIGYCLPVAFCKTSCRYVRLQRRSRSFGTALHLVPYLGVPAERGYAVLYGQDQRIRQA